MRLQSRRLPALFIALVILALPAQFCQAQEKLTVSGPEKILIDLVNQERAKKNLKPLVPNAKLFAAARAHSKNMVKHGNVAHVLDGKNSQARAKDHGYPSFSVGENLTGNIGEPVYAMKVWMNSEGHRANILSPNYSEIGVGLARLGNSEKYLWTQVFGSSNESDKAPTLQLEVDPIKGQLIFVDSTNLGTSKNRDPEDARRFAEFYAVKLQANKKYTIEMRSNEIDTFLAVFDVAKKTKLASNDDFGGGTNSQITFTPTVSGNYQIAAMDFAGAQGPFILLVYEK